MEWHKGDVKTTWICSPITYASVVHSTWPSLAMWWTHAPTFNKWHKRKNKKVTLDMLTHGAMWGCGLTSLVVYINDNFRGIRERNVTIRSEIWTTNIRSLGFRDIREWVTSWRLILWSLGCTRLRHFCSYNAVEYDAHFILEYPMYKPTRSKFPSLFENVVLGTLKSFFKWDQQDISLYTMAAIALCRFLEFKNNFISLHFT
jgi:hypothetical protein